MEILTSLTYCSLKVEQCSLVVCEISIGDLKFPGAIFYTKWYVKAMNGKNFNLNKKNM